jgi:hypothetical protein
MELDIISSLQAYGVVFNKNQPYFNKTENRTRLCKKKRIYLNVRMGALWYSAAGRMSGLIVGDWREPRDLAPDDIQRRLKQHALSYAGWFR